LDRDVALKLLSQDSLGDRAPQERLRKEARTLSKLNHPNIYAHSARTDLFQNFVMAECLPDHG
jgi:serine/threonine protein kinase